MAHSINIILTHLIDNETPHNIIITEKGRVAYIIPRQYENDESNLPINTCWTDLSGLVSFSNLNDFEELSEEDINKYLKNISLESDQFAQLTEKLVNSFEKLYIITKN